MFSWGIVAVLQVPSAAFVIPSDHKWFRNLAIAKIVAEYLEALNLKFPLPSVNLKQVRREYHTAKDT